MTENNMIQNQQQMIFSNMSEAVILLDNHGMVQYCNAAARRILGIRRGDSAQNLTGKKKNKKFDRLLKEICKGKKQSGSDTVPYHDGTKSRDLRIRTDIIQSEEKKTGTLLMMEDVTAESNLRRFEKDSAITFSAIVICICLYLFAWSLMEFTLGIHLKRTMYARLIEGIALILFFVVLFFTSLSLKDVGCFVTPKTLIKTFAKTIPIGLVAGGVLVLINVILRVLGHPVKPYFIGGSAAGAAGYISVAVLQEFLSRGAIQTSIRFLVRVKWQKFFNVLLSSLLFTLMHLPYGFPFMMGALVMGIALGIIFENQKNIWGCALLHWGCGYLAIAMFF